MSENAKAPNDPERIAALIDRHRPALLHFIERSAATLLRLESAEDLAHGIVVMALQSASPIEIRSDEEFFGWLIFLAKQYFTKRRAYWCALRRGGGVALRLSSSDTDSRSGSSVRPAISQSGPSTVAARREHLSLAMRALNVLYPRDRHIIQWLSEDLSIAEMATRRGEDYETTKKARQRAIERFRRTFDAVSRAKGGAQ